MRSNTLIKSLLAATLGLAMTHTALLASDEIVLAVPPEVHSVQSAGSWSDDQGVSGVFRVVLIGNTAGQQSLRVHWLATSETPDEHQAIIQNIQEIQELTHPIIGVTAQAGADGELSIYLESDPGDDPDLPYGYEIFVIDSSTYSFGVASN